MARVLLSAFIVWVFTIVIHAQRVEPKVMSSTCADSIPGPELMNERQQITLAAIAEMDARVSDIERSVVQSKYDIAALQNTVNEGIWLLRAVVTLLLGQFLAYVEARYFRPKGRTT